MPPIAGPISHRFVRSPFTYMANRGSADHRLTPEKAEVAVRDYLGKLGASLSLDSFTPGAGVHALVFGEWGHGKSQVMYRTAQYIEQHGHPKRIVVCRILPEKLSAREVLRAALADLRGRQPAIEVGLLTGLAAAYQELGALAAEDQNAHEILAQALLRFAQQGGFLHLCLLFDEAQTMGLNFQGMLKKVLDTFRENRLFLHTLQCHSVVSLDRARKIAGELGPLLEDATQIHLPSVQVQEAYEFYRVRLAECLPEAEVRLAERLIPDGVARTLCEAAGGNPRKMLQYAGEILAECDAADQVRFTGALVIKVFGQAPGLRPGSRLFQREVFQRTLDLLPQVGNAALGHKVRKFLEDGIGRLFGESWRPTAMDLSDGLQLSAADVQKALTQAVDGIHIFTSETDEDGDTQYRLTDEFRQRLCASFGTSGDYDLKQAQFGILLNPASLQVKISNGLAWILQHQGITTDTRGVDLGKWQGRYPLRGHAAKSRVNEIPVPILVTGLCGILPSEEMVARIVEGLRKQEWLRAYVFFYHPESRWSDWAEDQRGKDLLAPLKDCPDARIVALEHEHWQDVVPASDSSQLADSGIAAAQFFATLVRANALAGTQSSEVSEELAKVFGGLQQLMEENRLTMADLVYLPTESERRLLDHADWLPLGEQSLGWAELQDLGKEVDVKVSRSMAKGLENYVDVRNKKYLRRTASNSALCKVTLAALRHPGTHTEENLVQRIRSTALLVGRIENLPANVRWALRQLHGDGLVSQAADGSYAFRDLDKENRDLRKWLRESLAKLKPRTEALAKYRADWMAEIQVEFAELEREGNQRIGTPQQLNSHLSGLEQRASLLEAQISRQEARRETEVQGVLADLNIQLEDIRARREALGARCGTDWQTLVVPDSVLQEWMNELAALSTRAKGTEGFPHRLLQNEHRSLSSRINHYKRYFDAKQNPQATWAEEPRSQLLWLIASGREFREVLVDVEGV